MSHLFLDLMNPSIAPTPARELRAGVVAVLIVTAIVFWRVDDLSLQLLVPGCVAVMYAIRIAMAVSRQKRRRSCHGLDTSTTPGSAL